MPYFVIGGEYKNTMFEDFVEGKAERHGPFETFKEAEDKWRERSWATVDSCHNRYTIKKED